MNKSLARYNDNPSKLDKGDEIYNQNFMPTLPFPEKYYESTSPPEYSSIKNNYFNDPKTISPKPEDEIGRFPRIDPFGGKDQKIRYIIKKWKNYFL